MKRTAVVLVCLSLLACTSGNNQKVRTPEPDIDFVQLIGPADLNFPSGDIEVQYGMRIANRSEQAITLRRIELRSLGDGGPYRLQQRPYEFKTLVGPDQFTDVIWWARALASGNAFANDVNAPVSVRAIAYFETPNGMIRKVLVKNFTQFGGSTMGR